MLRSSTEYDKLVNGILLISEHTWGMDNKMYFADYENYLKDDFNLERKEDIVKLRKPFHDFPQNMYTVLSRFQKEYKQGSYKAIENSWQEQRDYIDLALSNLSKEH